LRGAFHQLCGANQRLTITPHKVLHGKLHDITFRLCTHSPAVGEVGQCRQQQRQQRQQ
jgi:hypothetical protein